MIYIRLYNRFTHSLQLDNISNHDIIIQILWGGGGCEKGGMAEIWIRGGFSGNIDVKRAGRGLKFKTRDLFSLAYLSFKGVFLQLEIINHLAFRGGGLNKV